MAFEKVVPIWNAAGVEPPESLKNSGFAANYKPPAEFFNWFWHNVSQCLTELQGMTPADIGAEAALYMGENPIIGAANDTYAQWLAKGTGYGFYNTAGQLNGQPSAQGYLLNIAQSRGVAQIWFELPGGTMYHRIGNTSGLTAWSEVPDGATVTAAIKAAQDAADKAQTTADNNAKRLTSLETYEQRPYEHTGEVVSFENFEGMPMNCVTVIEPIQSGSGDPYPAGGGKNLCGSIDDVIVQNYPDKATKTQSDNVITLATEFESGDGFIFGYGAMQNGRNYTISGKATGYANLRTYNKGDFSNILVTLTPDANGSFSYTFVAQSDDVVFRVWVNYGVTCTLTDFQIEESGYQTAYAPYANIRPISGRTGAKLTRCGKNLFENVLTSATTANSGAITYTPYTDGSYRLSGTPTNEGVFRLSPSRSGTNYSDKDTFPCLLLLTAGTYYLSGVQMVYRLPDSTPKAHNAMAATPDKPLVVTFDTDVEMIDVRAHYTAGETYDGVYYPMICTTAPGGWMPYQGDTFAADFGQTVYGGTLDWNTGVLTVDKVMQTLDDTTTVGSVGNYTNTVGAVIVLDIGGETKNAEGMCSHVPRAYTQNDTPHFFISSTQLNLFLPKSALNSADKAGVQAYLAAQYAAGTPVQVCYKLATPTTIQLTPQQIAALAGLNTIWSDAGKTTVSGRTDILWQTNDLVDRMLKVEDTVKNRNLYLGTRDFSGEWNSLSPWTVADETYRGLIVMKRTGAWGGMSQTLHVNAGETYTFSAWMKADRVLDVRAYPVSTEQENYAITSKASGQVSVGTVWQRYTFTTSILRSGYLTMRFETPTSDGTLYICGLKLEKGDQATEYITAPEDIWTEIDKIKAALSALATS